MPRKSPESWFQKAAELMVRENIGLRRAAVELALDLTQEECDAVCKRKLFQDTLRTERNRFYAEVANTPGRDKTSAVGLAVILIQKLIDAGEFDKALEGVMKLAKLEGFDKSEQINIFAGVTAKDLDEARKKILEQIGTNPLTANDRPPLSN